MAHLGVAVSLASVSVSRRVRVAFRNIGLFALSAALLIAAATAQIDPAGGILPFSTHVGGQYDSVDSASSNVTLNIPVRSKAGRIPFTFSLVANSHFSIQGPNGSKYWFNPMEGVGMQGVSLSSVFGASVTSSVKIFGSCNGHSYDAGFNDYSITDATGAVHPLPGLQWDEYGCYRSGSSKTSDGSGLSLNITGFDTWALYDRSGNSLSAKTFTDPDGVTMVETAVTSQIPELWTWTDTLGLTAMSASLAGGGTGNTGSGGMGPAASSVRSCEMLAVRRLW